MDSKPALGDYTKPVVPPPPIPGEDMKEPPDQIWVYRGHLSDWRASGTKPGRSHNYPYVDPIPSVEYVRAELARERAEETAKDRDDWQASCQRALALLSGERMRAEEMERALKMLEGPCIYPATPCRGSGYHRHDVPEPFCNPCIARTALRQERRRMK